MSLRLEIKKKMVERSPRVKAIDFHNQNTWIILGLYSGTLALHDYSNNTSIRTIQASNFPIRTVKFICSKHWIICGSDDFHIRVFNYNTMERVKAFQAHTDFIRSIVIHPSENYVISCSDDSKIKIWNYQKDFLLVRTLQEHKHFVLSLSFNPRDLTKFASGSMDKTIKIWNLTTEGKANLTLTGHKSSVNTIDFYKGDKPHLASGSDDKTIKIWDYQTKQCLTTLQCHSMPVTSLSFHPELPILFSTSEDGKSIIHHTGSWNVLNILEYNLGMSWAAAVSNEDHNVVAFGYDEGSVVIKIGSDEPIVSISNGKIIWAKSMQIYTANLKAIDFEMHDSGDKVHLEFKQLGSTDIYPTYLRHSPNSHHFALCNKKQFTVIKTAAFKTVVAGNGTNLIWQNDSDFAVLDNDILTVYRNFQKGQSTKVPFVPNKIFEGVLLTVADHEKTYFYEWSDLSKPLHKLELGGEKIWWNESGDTLGLASESKMIVFSFNPKTYSLTELISINEKVNSGVFVDQIFYYMTKSGKINFTFLGKAFFYANAEKKQFILGVLEQQQRLYLFDKTNSVYSHSVPFEVFKQVLLFIQGKAKAQPEIPSQLKDRVAKCYDAFDYKKQAYKLTQNQDHKFELGLHLGYIREAYKIATSTSSNQKIKVIGDISLKKGEVELAIQCFKKIDDLNTLLMIYSALQLPTHLQDLGTRAETLTKMNVAYMCYYLTNQPSKCVDVLIKSKRYSEAALFCRTYCNERVSECVKLWKQSLNDKALALKISDPTEDQEEGEESNDAVGEEGQE